MTRDPSLKKKDNRIEQILKNYDKYMIKKEKNRRKNKNVNKGLLDSSKDIQIGENPQLLFMKEVLYNYLDKELKIRRED